MKEYVLISPESGSIDIFRLDSNGQWVLWDARGQAQIRFESVDLTISTSLVFEGLPPAAR